MAFHTKQYLKSHTGRVGHMFDILSPEDYVLVTKLVGHRAPDLVIAPDGKPYLYRFIIKRLPECFEYLHIQVASDPYFEPHDHVSDNFSVILSGGYDELTDFGEFPRGIIPLGRMRKLRKGDTAYRKAEEAHRLILPSGIPYTVSWFCGGPKRREWGFYMDRKWVNHKDVIKTENGVSVRK